MATRVSIDQRAVTQLLNESTRGMLTDFGGRVARHASRLTRSSRVADAIDSRVNITPTTRKVEVGTFEPDGPKGGLAIWEHNGTKPHSIGSAVFIEDVGWRYIGKSPAGRGKIHPGTKAHPFLLMALRGEVL